MQLVDSTSLKVLSIENHNSEETQEVDTTINPITKQASTFTKQARTFTMENLLALAYKVQEVSFQVDSCHHAAGHSNSKIAVISKKDVRNRYTRVILNRCCKWGVEIPQCGRKPQARAVFRRGGQDTNLHNVPRCYSHQRGQNLNSFLCYVQCRTCKQLL